MTHASTSRPTYHDVVLASGRIASVAWRTPLVRSAWLSELLDAEVWLKLESVQNTGSFKIRGATNAVARLRESQPAATTVVTASAGNHGLGLATAAGRFGMRARVHLPAAAPDAKRRALARLGATMIDAATYDAAEAAAQEEVRRGATFISAYSHPDVIAGAGTIALEMLEAQPDLEMFVVPLGGGGLLSGTRDCRGGSRAERSVDWRRG